MQDTLRELNDQKYLLTVKLE
jgi:hypothetical protein